MTPQGGSRPCIMTLLCGLLCGLSLTLGWTAPVQGREFRAADTHPEDYPTVQAVLYMGRLVVEHTGGRHRIRLFHSRQLGEEKDTIAQTHAGAIDLNRVNLAPFTGIVPEAVVPSLPFLFRSREHLHQVLDGPIGEAILAAFEPEGFIGLAFFDSGARSFYTRSTPIRRPEEMKGLRIRVQQSDLFTAMVAALGAEPVPLAYGEVLTALTTGIIDGAENNWPSYQSSLHYTQARHYSLTRHTMTPEVLVMSRKAWESLSSADQAIFRAAAREAAQFMSELWNEREIQAEQKARAAGVQVHEPEDPAAFSRAMAPVYATYLREPRIAELVRRVQELP